MKQRETLNLTNRSSIMRLYPMTKVVQVLRDPDEPVYKPLHTLCCPRCFKEIEKKAAYRNGKEYHCVHCDDDFVFARFTNTEEVKSSMHYAYLTKVQ